MGAVRWVFTVGIIGMAAGAALAVATIPAFAPYADRERRDTSDSEAEDYATTARERHFNVEPGPRSGSVTLDVPGWVESAAGWIALGRRAMDEWSDWTGTGEDPREAERPVFRFVPREDADRPMAQRSWHGDDRTAPPDVATGDRSAHDPIDSAAAAAALAADVAREVRQAESDEDAPSGAHDGDPPQ